ncbi:MAG: heat-inducible transcriptional repressor HrcA [Eubacteriales bacterium]|nr:heat-inducible transcriptional repressor HrcA [Eubacteriales bacterium]MDY3333171.1 heat-inducible transcriptional repressor HrcA [Gallibacter sp.]
MELSERKLKILQAIIGDFVSTAEPVGSRTLSKRYDLGVSPATIRNEMADLEDMGLLIHAHTSSGRMPTHKAYRLYVDEIMRKKDLTQSQKKVITNKLYKNFKELDKTIEQAAKILSEITNLTSFAVTPTSKNDKLQYINIVPIDESTVILMIVADSGKVSNTTLKLKCDVDDETLRILSQSMSYNYKGKTLTEALQLDIVKTLQTDIEALGKICSDIMPSFIHTLEDMLSVNMYMNGITNIFQIPEYRDITKAQNFMEVLHRKDEFVNSIVDRGDGIIITIGSENDDAMLKDYSLVTATYHINGELVGKLGVIGPTRMNYGEVTAVVEYLTENLSNSFKVDGDNQHEDELSEKHIKTEKIKGDEA